MLRVNQVVKIKQSVKLKLLLNKETINNFGNKLELDTLQQDSPISFETDY